MDESTFDCLKLENQLCFPLYVCSKEIIKRYKPFLDKLDLTYTQYITMMVLWEKKEMNVSELGQCLYLDSGTLTPLLKKLESKGYIIYMRDLDRIEEYLKQAETFAPEPYVSQRDHMIGLIESWIEENVN